MKDNNNFRHHVMVCDGGLDMGIGKKVENKVYVRRFLCKYCCGLEGLVACDLFRKPVVAFGGCDLGLYRS